MPRLQDNDRLAHIARKGGKSLEGAEPMWRTGQTLKNYLAEKAK